MERILTGEIHFPAGTIPSIETDTTILVKYNTSDDVDESMAIYLNGTLMYGDDSDWGEGGGGGEE